MSLAGTANTRETASETSRTKAVTISGVTKAYPSGRRGENVEAIRGVDLTVEAGEFFVLLGPSGSGKTTLLRCIAGLETISDGEIRIGEQVVASTSNTVPASRRNIGMVFQDYAIWPHMTVSQNVEFALRHGRANRMSGSAAASRVAEVLSVVGLGALADRGATYLSGGQQQRVALARAIVARPDLLLFDEPLSNLDAALRVLMRKELRRIASELGVTSIYVTHDQVEALVMADHIAVMHDGLALQIGTPEEIYRRPTGTFVAGFIGEANLIDGTVVAPSNLAAGRPATVDTALGPMIAYPPHDDIQLDDGVQLVIRPENLHLRMPVSDATTAQSENQIVGTVESSVFAGAHTEVTISCGGRTIHAQVHAYDGVDVGAQITLVVGARWTVAVPVNQQLKAADHPESAVSAAS